MDTNGITIHACRGHTSVIFNNSGSVTIAKVRDSISDLGMINAAPIFLPGAIGPNLKNLIICIKKKKIEIELAYHHTKIARSQLLIEKLTKELQELEGQSFSR